MSRRHVSAVLVVLALSGCGASAVGSSGAASAQHPTLAGSALYVNPENPARVEGAALAAKGDAQDAALLERIASQPVATWFNNEAPPQLEGRVHAIVVAAAAQHLMPVLVAYDIPQRDCGAQYSSGGAATAARYLLWIARFAAGIGSNPAVVILEPDAIPDIVDGCLTGAAARSRLELLRQAVTVLESKTAASVYLDAGNASWIKPAGRLLAPLRAAGIDRADGFALNVANFQTTAASVAYGERLSRALHGAHFVIDTSRNGNGPDLNPADAPGWCDPPGRALGQPPTTDTGIPNVDALLWIKPPGTSDGSCRPGAPSAGRWWLPYALELANGGHR
jgi:endoglucanase